MSRYLTEQLKSLERLRQQRRQQSQYKVIEQQQRVEQMRSKLDTLQYFIDSPTPTLLGGLALKNHENYTQDLRRLYQWQQQQLQAAEQELLQRKAQLSLSHLQEKQLEQHSDRMRKAEEESRQKSAQKQSDELAMLRFGRKN
ncbi:hypothetical protein EFZ10_14470 [Tatumella sp. TA1]|uniref:hypothetical protein n=1 Tax=Rosenbergiella collisarenosi TaxID=1544695 RepID=UPI0008F95DC3|nr:hypothetical protein [Rosenbergiella collisarenosi]MBT0721896.1 hypothetical protein [Rosenbergiella collisarenosi]QGX92718.1 hypothetical protein EFZ10_14470 [Tatumella sp. TA1]